MARRARSGGGFDGGDFFGGPAIAAPAATASDAARVARSLTGAPYAGVSVHIGASERLVGWDGFDPAADGLDQEPILGRLGTLTADEFIPDVASDARMRAFAAAAPMLAIRTFAAVPIREGGTATGVIWVADTSERASADVLPESLHALAAMVARTSDPGHVGSPSARDTESLASARFRAVFDGAALGIALLDEEGQIVEANRALAEMLLTNGSSLVGRALSGERTAEDEDMLHGLLAGDWGNFRLDRVLTRSDGRTLWARIHVSLFPGDIGGSRQLVATVEDITQQRRMEDHLARTRDAAEAANRAKSAFLANMSHELRTPLNSVIGFTNLLLKNRAGNLTASDLDYLGRVLSNGRHLLELINDVLDLSKIEAGKMVVKPESVDVGALVTDVVRQLEGRVLDRPVRLVADVPAAPLAITADPAMLRQILINLVGNALKFTERGEVAVRVIYDDAGAARIDVEDTGVGIPPDRLGAIFEAFEQADTSTSRRFGGTGLGLTISRRFARAMGFEVAVSSTLNVGSVFAILLRPEAPTPPAPEPRTEPAE